MADQPKDAPKDQPAPASAPKAPEPKPGDPKAPAQQPTPAQQPQSQPPGPKPAGAEPGGTPDDPGGDELDDEPEPADAPRAKAGRRDNPMTSASMAEGQSSPAAATAGTAKKKAVVHPIPGGKELAAARKKRFGTGPGTVRLDAPPRNSGPDARPAMLVFVDGSGREVGREEYHPADEGSR